MKILIVCGLLREARLARGDGTLVVVGGGDPRGLGEALEAVDPGSLAAVVSFGVAGSLDTSVVAGDVVVPAAAMDLSGRRYEADAAMMNAWRAIGAKRPDEGGPGAIVGVDVPAMSLADKAELRRAAGDDAIAVDMESHHAGAYAGRHGLPFGMLRAISDGADHALPAVAGRAMRPDGSVDVLGVLTGLARDPGQIPALIRTARDAGRAFRALGRVRGLLGPRLGLQL